ncbi:DUF2804 domain-containing protein [Streptomyces sp. SCSIO 30461]|uniref:DUF2804 family protein n=1 Tax=Streptomyces sp. SCSIO 30461 TaxID=3118085 RepID=UPI00387E3F3A
MGLQLGGRWTDGTGATENALCFDGRITRIGREMRCRWSMVGPLAPWARLIPGGKRGCAPLERARSGQWAS